MNEDPNDPFFDCDKADRREMSDEKAHTSVEPPFDFRYLLEDLGMVSEILSALLISWFINFIFRGRTVLAPREMTNTKASIVWCSVVSKFFESTL